MITLKAECRYTDRLGISLPAPDIVINFRCSLHTMLYHHMYGPTGFSIYEHLRPYCSQLSSVVLHHGNGHIDPEDAAACGQLADALKEHLLGMCPSWSVHSPAMAPFEEFLSMVEAKVLVISRSTFHLAAAMMSQNHVVAPLMLHHHREISNLRTLHLEPLTTDWTWSFAPVLLRSDAEFMPFLQPLGERFNVSAVIDWLQAH